MNFSYAENGLKTACSI